MNCLVEISTYLKARDFEKATRLLKVRKYEVDGRLAFKVLRSLYSQLKVSSTKEENETEALEALIQTCCQIISKCPNITADEAEFTQGANAIYHLFVHFMKSSSSFYVIGLLLSKTMSTCLQKLRKHTKEVETIALSLFSKVWNFAKEIVTEKELLSFRQTGLSILIHMGSRLYWNQTIDRLVAINQDPSASTFSLTEAAFDALLLYLQQHNYEDIDEIVPYLLQIWIQLVHSSSSFTQYSSHTEKLTKIAQDTVEPKQIKYLMNVVLNVFGSEENTFEVYIKEVIGKSLLKELEVVLVRIIILALNLCAEKFRGKSVDIQWSGKHQLVTLIQLFLLFLEQADKLKAAESLTNMDPHTLKNRCMTRAASLSHYLLKVDKTQESFDLVQIVFQRADRLVKYYLDNDQTDSIIGLLKPIELSAYNVGAVLYSSHSHSKEFKTYTRKSIEYLVRLTTFSDPTKDETTFSNITSRFNILYDIRKYENDWSGVVSDFLLYVGACYAKEKTSNRIICVNQSFQQHFMSSWSRFKRDLILDTSITDEKIMGLTLLDLLTQINFSLDPTSAWELLHEEYQFLDRRKGLVPKVAISAVVKQATIMASTPLQKGICSFFMSREGTNQTLRNHAAKKAISKLSTQASLSGTDSLGQIYLALSYLEFYVSQQEMLKKKTEEEMASLGPLIKSSSSADTPPGEDGSGMSSDGTSVEAVSYSYLKLELELKNQDFMVKSLVQWEELVQFGWTLENYSSIIFNCLKSLGYYFKLYGNSLFSARAWLLLLKAAETAKCTDELILAVSELLKLNWNVESEVIQRCKDAVDKKSTLPQDAQYFFVCLAWSKYYQEDFKECCQILETKVPISGNVSKSVMLVQAEAFYIRSLLAMVPPEMHPTVSSNENGPAQMAFKSALACIGSYKAYVSISNKKGFDFYGQEWHVLSLLVTSCVNLSRTYMYSALPREARFFLKEALNATQKHVVILRTAEVLLEFCKLDLMLDNTMDCQSKLVLVCHLMGVAPPVIPDVPAVGGNRQAEPTPGSPVQIRSRNQRAGFAAKQVPEMPINLQQDATHRSLQQPFNHQGTSPSVKAREVTDGIFPEHSLDCYCLTCTSELVATIRFSSLATQAKLWSILGFEDVAKEEFVAGSQLVEFVCSRLRSQIRATKTSSKRLFNIPEALKVSEIWSEHRVFWFQAPFITGLELMLEYAWHLSSLEAKNDSVIEFLNKLKTLLREFYIGPLQDQAVRLATGVEIVLMQFNAVPVVARETTTDANAMSPVVGATPKTPALEPRKPPDIPPPRLVRRNILAVKIDDTITIEDDEDSDSAFTRRLGQPRKPLIYSSDESDNDSDFLGPTPPPSNKKPIKKMTTTEAKNKLASQVAETAFMEKKVRGVVAKKVDDSPVIEASSKPSTEKKSRATTKKTTNVLSAVETTSIEKKVRATSSKNQVLQVIETDSKPLTEKKVRAATKKSDDLLPVAETAPAELKKVYIRKTKTPSLVESNSSNGPATTVKAEASKEPDVSEPVIKPKQENKFFKSRQAVKLDSQEEDLSSRLAAAKITDINDSRPKKTTRSTRK